MSGWFVGLFFGFCVGLVATVAAAWQHEIVTTVGGAVAGTAAVAGCVYEWARPR